MPLAAKAKRVGDSTAGTTESSTYMTRPSESVKNT